MTPFKKRAPERGEMSSRSRLAYRSLLFLLLAVLFVTRLGGLEIQSLWIDELLTAYKARMVELSAMLNILREDAAHPPLYYLILWTLGQAADLGHAASLRAPSAVAGVLAGLLILLLPQRTFHPEAKVVALSLFVFSTHALHYSQEAKSYAITMLFGFAACILLSRLVSLIPEMSRCTWPLLILLAAVGMALSATHFFGAVLIIILFTLIAVLMYATGYRPMSLLIAGALCLLAITPIIGWMLWTAPVLLERASSRLSSVEGSYFRLTPDRLLDIPHQWLGGWLIGDESAGAVLVQVMQAAILLALAIWTSTSLARWGAWKEQGYRLRVYAVLIGVSVVGVASLVALSSVTPMFHPRMVIGFFPFFLIGLSGFITMRREIRPVAITLIPAVAAAGFSASLAAYYAPFKEQWREVAQGVDGLVQKHPSATLVGQPVSPLWGYYLEPSSGRCEICEQTISTHTLMAGGGGSEPALAYYGAHGGPSTVVWAYLREKYTYCVETEYVGAFLYRCFR